MLCKLQMLKNNWLRISTKDDFKRPEQREASLVVVGDGRRHDGDVYAAAEEAAAVLAGMVARWL